MTRCTGFLNYDVYAARTELAFDLLAQATRATAT
jgi:hypothetical protein